MIGCICGGIFELLFGGLILLISASTGWLTSWYNHHKLCKKCKNKGCDQ